MKKNKTTGGAFGKGKKASFGSRSYKSLLKNAETPISSNFRFGVGNKLAHTYPKSWKPREMVVDVAGAYSIKFAEVHTEHDQHIGSPQFVKGYCSGKMMDCHRFVGKFNGVNQVVYTDYDAETIDIIFKAAGYKWEPSK